MKPALSITALTISLLLGCNRSDPQSDAQRAQMVGTWSRPIPLGVGGTQEIIEFRADGTFVSRSGGPEKTAKWRIEKGKLILGSNPPQSIRALTDQKLAFGEGDVAVELTRQTPANQGIKQP